MIVERKIGTHAVRAECSAVYARPAENVLDSFEKLAKSGRPLRSGSEIRFGWTLLRLGRDGDALVVTEPNFAFWPEQLWSRTIDVSLEVLTAQVRLLHRLKVDGEDAYFDQFIIAAPGAMAQSRVFLRRDSGISAEDSGWALGSVEDPEALAHEVDLEPVAIASLVRRRPALLQVLTLPPGFIVVFSDDSIEQIFDAGGRQLLLEERTGTSCLSKPTGPLPSKERG